MGRGFRVGCGVAAFQLGADRLTSGRVREPLCYQPALTMSSMRQSIALLFVSALTARAFVLKCDDAGLSLHWELSAAAGSAGTNVVNPRTPAIRFFLASDGFSATNTVAELRAIRAAFAQWQTVPGTRLKFEDAGLVRPPVDINTDDHTNVVFWTKQSVLVNAGRESLGGRSGSTTLRTAPNRGVILEGDIALNGIERKWTTDCGGAGPLANAECVEAVALHEIGHLLGLEHSPLGGATMFFRAARGKSLQVGLSVDDIAAVRFLYPAGVMWHGAIQGVITKKGRPVFGAAVFAQDSAGNAVAGTVTRADGMFQFNMMSPGGYLIRAAPLDPLEQERLCAGPDIAPGYSGADTEFTPTTNRPVRVRAGMTNHVDFSVSDDAPAFRITNIRVPTTAPGAFVWASLPVSLRVAEGNHFVGVASANLPTNNATLTVTGDGLSLGATTFHTIKNSRTVLNFLSARVTIASNATPGLRTFVVQQGTNTAYAHGFLEILPAR